MKIRTEPLGRGKFQVVVEDAEGRAVASSVGLLADRKERERVIAELRKDTPGLDRAQLEDVLLREGAKPPVRAEATDEPPAIVADEPSTEAELEEAREILRSGDLLDQIETDLAAIGIAGESAYKLTAYLVATSRCLRKPLHAIVRGDSSSGKSHVAEKIADLLPREHVVDATHLSPKALYRMEGMLEHRFLLMGERSRQEGSEIEDATKALRELRSRGRLTAAVVEEGQVVKYNVEGPIASIETTTKEELFDEDANRCLLLNADESPDQTARVLGLQAAQAVRGEELVDPSIRRRHVAIQRVLADLAEPPKIVIPFAEKLVGFIPTTRTDARRTFPMLLGIIKASAFLHRFQREIEDDAIVAGVEDYAVALRLVGPVLNAALGEDVSEPVRRFWEALRRNYSVGVEFTAPELATRIVRKRQRVNELLKPLWPLGVIDMIEEPKGPHPATWKVVKDSLPTGENVLPKPEALR
jgi:hypothetical protein